MKSVFLLFLFVALSSQAPQNWPYRNTEGMEYYGYQRRLNNNGNNFYRNVGVSSGEDDDEVEVHSSNSRQDLKVGGQSSQTSQDNAVVNKETVQTQVVETGSAKPVANENAVVKATSASGAAKQPEVANTGVKAQQPPAFPPATPPAQPSPQDPEDSEEDSDEEEEAEEDDQEDYDEDQDEEEDRRRNDPVIANVTNNKPTVEALVPGYVTEQGEVLVPFDTVVDKGNENNVVAVVDDPSYEEKAPVVVVNNERKSVPKFFKQVNNQIYYSQVPPPGSIFTFDDDEIVVGRARQDTSSEEEDDFPEDDDDDTEDEEDDGSEEEDEEERSQKKKQPLSFVKATSPSGEDDEAESLGIRLSRRRSGFINQEYYQQGRYPPARSPNLFYVGNGYYIPRYNGPDSRPGYYHHEEQSSPSPTFYYRPASKERVKVVPIGSFDVSLEEREVSERVIQGVRVSPISYYGMRHQYPRRPVMKPVSMGNNRRVFSHGPTPVVYQKRVSVRDGRGVKDKKKKVAKKQKKEKKKQ